MGLRSRPRIGVIDCRQWSDYNIDPIIIQHEHCGKTCGENTFGRKRHHINSTHLGLKTYCVRDVTGAIQPITTLYVPGLDQDLLGGRALIKAKYRMVLDEDPTISGIFPVTVQLSDGQIDPATGFLFAESEGLF